MAFGEVLAFTGVDIYTKEAEVVLRTGLTSEDGAAFLRTAMTSRFTGPVQIVQTDGGPEFKGAFDQLVLQYCMRHRIARPSKKNEQAHIESFNRTLWKDLSVESASFRSLLKRERSAMPKGMRPRS